MGEVIVVAPDREKSACSHSLTLHHPLRAELIRPSWFAVDGTPADCVNIAVNGMFPGRRPDLIISGINIGANLGEDIIYSGTVAAAEEGAMLKIPSLAVSVDARRDCLFEGAVYHTLELAKQIVANGWKPECYLNLNSPNLPLERIKGVRYTNLGHRLYDDILERRTDPRGKVYYWIGGQEAGSDNAPGSDMEALAEGFFSVTPLTLYRTDDQVLSELRRENPQT